MKNEALLKAINAMQVMRAESDARLVELLKELLGQFENLDERVSRLEPDTVQLGGSFKGERFGG